MSPRPVSPAQCLAVVEKSPAAVAAHNKAAWLGLFASYSLVEDPVGSRPCVSRPGDTGDGAPLSKFYETFIAPNDIQFKVLRDMVTGTTVVRDLRLEITMAGGSQVTTPMHLLYELVEEAGELKVFRLAAYWELPGVLKQRSGGMGAFWRMLRILGVGGVIGFLRALSSVGHDGKARVAAFSDAFNQRQADTLSGLFTPAARRVRLMSVGKNLAVTDLLRLGTSIRLGKTLSAGNVVSSSFELERESRRLQGVAFFHFQRSSMLIEGLDIYWCE